MDCIVWHARMSAQFDILKREQKLFHIINEFIIQLCTQLIRHFKNENKKKTFFEEKRLAY